MPFKRKLVVLGRVFPNFLTQMSGVTLAPALTIGHILGSAANLRIKDKAARPEGRAAMGRWVATDGRIIGTGHI